MSQQTLGAFCTFTNTDATTAKLYLIDTNWNLNLAINRYFKFIQDCHTVYTTYKSLTETQSTASNNQHIYANRTRLKRLLTYGFSRKYSTPSAITDSICSFYFSATYDAWCTQYIYSKDAAHLDCHATKVATSFYEVTLFSDSVVRMGAIHTFKLRILSIGYKEANSSFNASLQPFVGIIKDDPDTLIQFRDDFDYWKVDEGYQFCCGRALFRGNSKKKQYGTRCCSKGDVIEIKVDLIEWTLSFVINGTDYGIACVDLDHSEYRLALSSVNVPAQFELF
eukprot:304103_1